MNVDKEWYYASGQEQVGPYSWDQLLALRNDGTLPDETYIWSEGMPEWKSLGEMIIASAPAPVPTVVAAPVPTATTVSNSPTLANSPSGQGATVSPYSTPESFVSGKSTHVPSEEFIAPEETLKKIRAGWIAAVIQGTLVTVLALISFDVAPGEGLSSKWNLIDAVLIFGLAFGIAKKSRTASTIMFAYFILNRIIYFMATGQFPGIVISIIFFFIYLQAMIATYEFHNLKKRFG